VLLATATVWTRASESAGAHLAAAVRELQSMPHSLQRDRNGRNLPSALPFEEERLRDAVERGGAAGASSASATPLPVLRPHPDVVMPRYLRYHTPVWDALIWRFVNHVEPTGYSQHAHLLCNYPPYLVAHSEPLDPSFHAASAMASPLAAMSLHMWLRWTRLAGAAATPFAPSLHLHAAAHGLAVSSSMTAAPASATEPLEGNAGVDDLCEFGYSGTSSDGEYSDDDKPCTSEHYDDLSA
jgi:hypothetical protein